MLKILNEMALSRSDAIDLCIGLGKQFIEHYRKISNNDCSFYHHVQEMQSWWDRVKRISLKPRSRRITDINLVDWFFTAGGDIEEYLEEDLIDEYNKLIITILGNKDKKIIDILGIEELD